MRRRLFVALVVVHALVLAGWAASLERALTRAATVRLEIVQRDPRDLLRGDYVWLNYRISEVPLAAFSGRRPEYGDRVWVALAPKEGVWQVAGASLAPLAPALDQRLITGRMRGFVYRPRAQPDHVRVAYGIERYYVPEGKGTAPRGKLEAEVALADDGRPFLTRIFVDGRPYP